MPNDVLVWRGLVGSSYFFSSYPDFIAHDQDIVELIQDNYIPELRHKMRKTHCLFQVKWHTTCQEYLDIAKQHKVGMTLGKFLVPEFAQVIGMTPQDLLQLAPLVERLDRRHKYEEIIYNAYLENNSFTLTQAQRDAAYLSYKQSRNLI